jgi:hypothetical protein
MSTADRRGAERLASRSRHAERGFLFDLIDQIEGERSPGVLRKDASSKGRRELQRLDARVLPRIAWHLVLRHLHVSFTANDPKLSDRGWRSQGLDAEQSRPLVSVRWNARLGF